MAIPEGEIFGFLGANGAGKTTTMRMLCGLTKPTAGTGMVAGHEIWKGRYAIRPKFGYVAQKFSLYPDLTVLENLRFFGAAYQVNGKRLRDRIEALLDQLDLRAKRGELAGSLSGGMKQLLALACAQVHEPRLLFLDEPTSGLDPVHRQQIWDLLYELSSHGTTIFVTTHYMDEAERCTEVGLLRQGRLLAKDTPLRLKEMFKGRLLEMQVEPAMEGLARLREVPWHPGGRSTQRTGAYLFRHFRAPPGGMAAGMALPRTHLARPQLDRAGHGRCLQVVLPRLYRNPRDPARPMNVAAIFRSIASVAKKEFLHIVRDWRVLVLILSLPPAFTLLFGHAFEGGSITGAPALLRDADQSPESQKLFKRLRENKTFSWQVRNVNAKLPVDLLKRGALIDVVIPPHWGHSLADGDPLPLHLTLDGTDTNTAPQLQGAVQETLGKFQLDSRQDMIDNLPDEVFELGKKIPEPVRKEFTSAMSPWTVESKILYNPDLKFIDYVMPGIVGLILQLLTVTLTACTIARERESGTLAQLLVTPLSRNQIVAGKVFPHLIVSLLLIAATLATGHFHFHVEYRSPALIGLLCLLFLVCSLGTGLLISSFCQTQSQAIQFAVFYLLPVFPLSGAFAPLDQLPDSIQLLAQAFPLTHFCHAFRLVSLCQAGPAAVASDLVFLFVGAVVTCLGAAFLLKRIQD